MRKAWNRCGYTWVRPMSSSGRFSPDMLMTFKKDRSSSSRTFTYLLLSASLCGIGYESPDDIFLFDSALWLLVSAWVSLTSLGNLLPFDCWSAPVRYILFDTLHTRRPSSLELCGACSTCQCVYCKCNLELYCNKYICMVCSVDNYRHKILT